ncbi:MAG: hypothetical protein JRJ85_20035, partial [Deltaproteobacteria bacterium]|nr:hypothetical protein [Deltaproteobacteria bacterium]
HVRGLTNLIGKADVIEKANEEPIIVRSGADRDRKAPEEQVRSLAPSITKRENGKLMDHGSKVIHPEEVIPMDDESFKDF